MPRSSRSFLFPDVNVWIALTSDRHLHHAIAARWFVSLDEESRLCFCRITQLSLLRLLTTQAVMGPEVMTQPEAWQVYDRWLDDPRIAFLDEPTGLEHAFRSHSRRRSPSPKEWADSYLLAFAATSGLRLVTFDQAFRGKTKNVLILSS
ncbi:MAG TPA: TA system VapC family ribonuclease toxin [Terriglobales bacterium]|nr:TA system VapC family ribonuclease toxin [Terriglobales bacterium]